MSENNGCLVLTRRAGERIILTVGDTVIELETLGINRNQVRLGFKAPRSVAIVREEIIGKPRKQA